MEKDRKATAEEIIKHKVAEAEEIIKHEVAEAKPNSIMTGENLIGYAIDRHTLAQYRIADAIDRLAAAQGRIAQVQEKQLNITVENAEKIKEIIEGLEKVGKELWEEIVNCESYKKYMKSILDK